MAPDRGPETPPRDSTDDDELEITHETSRSITQEPIGQEPTHDFLSKRSEQPQFTLRALLLGLLIGILIAFSNTYFGLQTGWISGMAMPSALIGFAYFKGLRALICRLGEPMKRWGWGEDFSEVENVLVQTVAGSLGSMPLGCGFVGVVPALQFLLKPEETPESSSKDPEIVSMLVAAEQGGGLQLPLGKLVLWALGLCFFGVVFAVPLRKEVIVREKLRFPSGTATALMIGVLHGGEKTGAEGNIEEQWARQRKGSGGGGNDEEQRLMGDMSPEAVQGSGHVSEDECDGRETPVKRDWKKQIRLLLYSFCVSGAYVSVGDHLNTAHSLTCTFIDPHLLLHPASSLDSYPRHVYVLCLALEP
jgi:uncharacterized oligopeptide transporter (OPT) family protein